MWDDLQDFSSDSTTADYLGSTGADWMEQNQAQVACFCPGVENSGGGISGFAQGLLSWNEGSEYYYQDGESGSLMDSC